MCGVPYAKDEGKLHILFFLSSKRLFMFWGPNDNTSSQAGEYDLDDEPSTIAKPTPYIMHNKLRLAYRQR